MDSGGAHKSECLKYIVRLLEYIESVTPLTAFNVASEFGRRINEKRAQWRKPIEACCHNKIEGFL